MPVSVLSREHDKEVLLEISGAFASREHVDTIRTLGLLRAFAIAGIAMHRTDVASHVAVPPWTRYVGA